MKALGSGLAGGLLACVALIVAAGPAMAAQPDGDAAGAPGDAPHMHQWNHDGDGHDQQEGWQHHGWHHHHHGEAAMFRELGLTDAQRASMKSILDAAKPGMKDLHEKLRANFKLLQQSTPDDKNYAQLEGRISKENGDLTAKLMLARSKIFAQCYAVLEPIQKTRLAEVRAKRAKWTDERMQHMQQRMHDGQAGHGPQHGDSSGGAPPPN
jgi:periplasmic protein CpxP/Spy